MDSIIPLIIMLIVGALLSGKKKKSSQQEEAKPFTAQQGNPDGPVKKLKEMYQELQQEMQQETKQQQPPTQSRQMSEPAPRVQVEFTPKPVETSVSSKREGRDRTRSRHSTRGKSTRIVQTKQKKIQVESILPRTKDDLIKGVIFSEIYGPPKSKR